MSHDRSSFPALRRQLLECVFSRMNRPQQQAVFQTDGPVLILAGAGSGKTTVLVNRIANLVQYGEAYHSEETPISIPESAWEQMEHCLAAKTAPDAALRELCAVSPCPPWRILAITFTNKAAGELKDRLVSMLGEEGAEVCAGTFHAFCARVLRKDGEALGFSSHFTIYDTDDSRRLMKECLKTLGIEERILNPKQVLNEISRAKDSLLSPAAFAAEAGSDFRLKKVAQCYELYQRRLKEADAMDFDDLLYHVVQLFETQPDILARYQDRFRYLMIDEYQDTNHAQYRFVSLMAEKSRNLCVVGDDDQSIYKFRGATIDNILNFEHQFSPCTVIRLEQNYRSTQTILDAANTVIAQNRNRKGKTLWTENGKGEPIHVHVLENEDEEGRFIARTVLDKVASGNYRYRDMAVLYRANAQSNAIERSLAKSGIPYRIIGGHRFNDTQEVRDAIAYLRVINNPGDTVSLRRIINQPRRGIGDTTVDTAAALAEEQGIPLYEVISHAGEYAALSRSVAKLEQFSRMIESLRDLNDDDSVPLHQLYTAMLEQTGYLAMWQAAGETEIERVNNLNELESSIRTFELECDEQPAPLSGFLEENALMTDIDNYDAGADAMVLMTMHAAKGLEFPIVFLPGFEDGIFPGQQTLFLPEELEEDRRLCYVAITRAKRELFISRACSRMLYGSTTRNRASCFLADIPEDLTVTKNECFSSDYGARTAYNRSDPFGSSRFGSSERTGFSRYDSQIPFGGTNDTAYTLPRRTAPKTGIGGGISAKSMARGVPSAATESWAAGDIVEHKAFGVGCIQAVQPMGNDTLLTIQFEKVGVKKIMATFAHLTRR